VKGSRPVHHPSGDCHSLEGIQRNCSFFKVDQELTFENEKKLIVIIVLMPMILSLDDSHPHNAVIHLCESLIEPFVAASFDYCRNIYDFEMSKSYIKVCGVGVFLCH